MLEINKYTCPHCKSNLSTSAGVSFLVNTQKHKNALVYLSPKIGDYSYTSQPKLELIRGERVDFYCPACHIDLTSPKHEDYIEIWIEINNLIKFEVEFCRISGERKTYVITEEYIEKHGENPPDFEEIFRID